MLERIDAMDVTGSDDVGEEMGLDMGAMGSLLDSTPLSPFTPVPSSSHVTLR